jgi:hypothetical protein
VRLRARACQWCGGMRTRGRRSLHR